MAKKKLSTFLVVLFLIWVVIMYGVFSKERHLGESKGYVEKEDERVSNLDNKVDKTNEIYDEKYFAYQKKMGEFGGKIKGDFLSPFCEFGSTNSAIEFGSGGGYVIGNLNKCKKRTGIEVNPTAVENSKKLFPKVKIYDDLDKLDYDDKYSFVFSTSVIEHVDCPICEVRKMKRIMEDDGIALIMVKNEGIKREEDVYIQDNNHHIYTWNGNILGNLIEIAGLELCECYSEYSAWKNIKIEDYLEDECQFCKDNLKNGVRRDSLGVWCYAAKSDKSVCKKWKNVWEDAKECSYLCG